MIQVQPATRSETNRKADEAINNLLLIATCQSWDTSASPAEDKKDYAHHQKQKEQNLRDSG
jgi:hypothetical protein